jgi:hypothetical protein
MALQESSAHPAPSTMTAKLLARTPSPAPLPPGIPGFGAAQKALDGVASRREATKLPLPESVDDAFFLQESSKTDATPQQTLQHGEIESLQAPVDSAPTLLDERHVSPVPTPRVASPVQEDDVSDEDEREEEALAEGMGAPFGLAGVDSVEFT